MAARRFGSPSRPAARPIWRRRTRTGSLRRKSTDSRWVRTAFPPAWTAIRYSRATSDSCSCRTTRALPSAPRRQGVQVTSTSEAKEVKQQYVYDEAADAMIEPGGWDRVYQPGGYLHSRRWQDAGAWLSGECGIREFHQDLHRSRHTRPVHDHLRLDLHLGFHERTGNLRSGVASGLEHEQPQHTDAASPARLADHTLCHPALYHRQGVGRPAQPGVGHPRHQMGSWLVHRSFLGQDRHPDCQPLAGLPIHVPDHHGRSAEYPVGHLRGSQSRRRRSVVPVPPPHIAAAAGVDRSAC